ncbi:hypothetical protein [Soonwooa purpurea]
MALNKRNIILILLLAFLMLIFAYIWNQNNDSVFFRTELSGIIEEIKSNGRFENSKVAKYKNEKDFNYLFWFYTPNSDDLKVGDSIFKSKNSYDYEIYRLDKNDHYEFYKILKRNP